VEVFRTDVSNPQTARQVTQEIESSFPDYVVNFDLSDCDRILRIETNSFRVDVQAICNMLRSLGVKAAVLPDEPVAQSTFQNHGV
jgi:hypothetical protein